MSLQHLDLRAEILERCKLRLELEAAPPIERAKELERCARDPVWFIERWVWTYDPRRQRPYSKSIPLRLWPRQRELVRWVVERIRRGENGLLKKGRDLGATVIMAAIAAWLWLFEPGAAIKFGSRKAELVDKLGDPDTIFYKVRTLIEHLPAWFIPTGFDRKRDDNWLLLKNPDTGATIKGEGGDEMGRGGRGLVYFVDEHAFLPRPGKVDAAINDNAECVIYLSTSNGVGTLFWQKEQEGNLPIFHFFWRDDPRKDEAWRTKKLLEVGPATFAREHEGDDGSALDNLLIPAPWVLAAVEGDSWQLAPGYQCVAALDVADGGADDNAYGVRRGPLTTRIEGWQVLPVMRDGQRVSAPALPDESGQHALAMCEEEGADLFIFDRVGVGSGVAAACARLSPPYPTTGLMAGSSPSDRRYDDDPRLPANERFANLGTELWWALRRRFQKTYEHIHGVREHPLDELICIPYHPQLISQLSSRQYAQTEAGKIKAESKKDMRARGVKSPDYADMLAMLYAPVHIPAPLATEVYVGGGHG